MLGDRERLEELTVNLRAQAVARPRPSVVAAADLAEGVKDGNPDMIRAAANGFAGCEWPLLQALSMERLAVAHAHSGRLADALLALEEAVSLYAGLDATWDESRAGAALRQLGVRRGIRGARKRPRTGWAALTATEKQVAELVRQGKTNPAIAAQLFMSRYTVQSHVSSILSKLGFSSRSEIAAAAALEDGKRAPLR